MKSAQATRTPATGRKQARHIFRSTAQLLKDVAGITLLTSLGFAVVFAIGLMAMGLVVLTGVVL